MKKINSEKVISIVLAVLIAASGLMTTITVSLFADTFWQLATVYLVGVTITSVFATEVLTSDDVSEEE